MIGKLTTSRTIVNNLILDEHTRPFFSPKYHEGAVEAYLHLGYQRLGDRVFVARLARLLTSEWVIVAQPRCAVLPETGPAPCFVLEIAPCLTRDEREAYWNKLASECRITCYAARIKAGETIPLTVSGIPISRCHFDATSTLGCRVPHWGIVDTVDLKPPIRKGGEKHKEALREIVDGGGPLRNLNRQEFHREMEEMLHDPQGSAHQFMRFFAQEEEERHLDALNLTSTMHRLLLKKFEREILEEVFNGNDLEGCIRVGWRPWYDKVLRVYWTPNQREFIPVPEALKSRCANIAHDLGGVVPSSLINGKTVPHFDHARWQWVRDFKIHLDLDTAHNSTNYLLDLEREIEELEGEVAATQTP